MTEPPGMERVEFIEIDGLKIRFRRNLSKWRMRPSRHA